MTESFDSLLSKVASSGTSRTHKRLKFVNRNLADVSVIEQKLAAFVADNVGSEELTAIRSAVANCDPGEARVCEYILALISVGEQRVTDHATLVTEVVGVMRRADEVAASRPLMQSVAERCSLAVYDCMQFVVSVKRAIVQLAAIYQVPYYYEAGPDQIRLRSSLLSTFKNLNTTIDDMQTLGEALWVVRNRDLLAERGAVHGDAQTTTASQSNQPPSPQQIQPA